MTKIIVEKITHMDNIPRKLVVTLVPCLVCIFVVYGFLVRQTILNVVEREKAGKEMSGMLSSLSSLEAQYLGAKEGINLDVAYAKGFKDAESPSFITRGSLGKADLPLRIQ